MTGTLEIQPEIRCRNQQLLVDDYTFLGNCCPPTSPQNQQLWLKILLIYPLCLESTRRISQFFLGLMSDTSEYSLQINFCFLFARHYIWGCRTCNRTPQLKIFLKTLHSRYKIESYKQWSTNNPTNKKWYPLVPFFNGNC